MYRPVIQKNIKNFLLVFLKRVYLINHYYFTNNGQENIENYMLDHFL